MGKYIFNRILQVLPVIVGVLIISFVLMVVLPGDPVLSMVGERYDKNTVEIMRKKLNLDKPLIVRMGMFLGDVVKGATPQIAKGMSEAMSQNPEMMEQMQQAMAGQA